MLNEKKVLVKIMPEIHLAIKVWVVNNGDSIAGFIEKAILHYMGEKGITYTNESGVYILDPSLNPATNSRSFDSEEKVLASYKELSPTHPAITGNKKYCATIRVNMFSDRLRKVIAMPFYMPPCESLAEAKEKRRQFYEPRAKWCSIRNCSIFELNLSGKERKESGNLTNKYEDLA